MTKKKQQIFTYENFKPENIWPFCMKKKDFIIKIVIKYSFSVDGFNWLIVAALREIINTEVGFHHWTFDYLFSSDTLVLQQTAEQNFYQYLCSLLRKLLGWQRNLITDLLHLYADLQSADYYSACKCVLRLPDNLLSHSNLVTKVHVDTLSEN